MQKNIFEWLWLPSTYRESEKTTMKVKHYDEVPVNKHKFPVTVQEKKDGVYALVMVFEDRHGTFSRAGKQFTNLYDMSYNFYMKAKADGIYIAELCNDHCSLEELSGLINPNRKAALSKEQESLMERCYYAFHDFISIDDFICGRSSLRYSDRYSLLCSEIPHGYHVLRNHNAWTETEVQQIADAFIKRDSEGIVIKPNEKWVAGHKGYRMMKKVRNVSYDLLCVGVEEGKGKYKGKVANLFFKWKDGQTIKAMLGKGWTHDIAERMWKNVGYEFRKGPVGQVFKVYALQESSKGKLRLPKVGELRIDKTDPDY